MKGPGQANQNKNTEDDILGLDLLGTSSNQQTTGYNQMNLLDEVPSKQK